MNLDTFSISALADEFRLAIMGGRVQKVLQISPATFSLEIYAQKTRYDLLLSAEPDAPRVFLQSQKPRRGTGKPTPLQELMRKYLRGSRLMTIEQPPHERVLMFHFSGQNGETTLIAELLGTRSNLIFTDASGRILGLVRMGHRSRDERPLLPNQPYRLPPAPPKADVDALSVGVLGRLLADFPPERRLSKALVATLPGLSPLIAREIVFRASGSVEQTVAGADLPALLETIRLVYHHINDHSWLPHVVFTAGHDVDLFAPIALTHRPNAEPVESMSVAVEAHFSRGQSAAADGYFAARLPVQQKIAREMVRLERRLAKLDEDAAALADPARIKQQGDAILACSYQIRPGQTELTVEWEPGNPLTIRLDSTLSPAENAQRYFARYKKAKRAADIIPAQQAEVRRQIDYLAQLTLDVELAETRPEIDAVRAALNEVARQPGHRPGGKKQPPPRAGQFAEFTSPQGAMVWVGKNALQNHRLTFSRAAPDDLWLHARGVPGAHVVIPTAQGEPPDSAVQWAAGVAAWFSKRRADGAVEVSCTRKKYVRAIKGAPPGLVTIREETVLRVVPLDPLAASE